jgi:branched-chain amino acid transport system substrate-binding protein
MREQNGRRLGLRIVPIAVIGAALALVVAACGGGGGNEAAPATTAPAAPATTATETPPATTAPASTGGTESGGNEVTDYVAYVGSSATGAADSSLSPIKIGWINQEGGPIEIGKTADDGADLGVKFINEQAGGIDGHPVELVKCFITQSEEEGQKCGQQFANDPSVVAVMTGAVAIGSESLHAALGNSKPVIVGVSVNPVDTTQQGTAILYGDAQYILAPYATFAKDVLHTKSAALVFPQGAGLDSPAAGQTTAFQAAGIPIKKVSYPANATDLTVPLVAAGAKTADLVMPVINPNDCVKFEQAIKQLGIPDDKVLASPICLTPTTIQGLGDFPQWIYAIASTFTFDTTDPAVPPYQAIVKQVEPDKAKDLIGDPWVNVGFGEAVTLAKWLNEVGADNITTDGIVQQMKAFNGPLALGSPVIKCGKYPEAPGVCNDYTQFYQYFGKNVFKKAGDWVPPPAGWTAPNS